MARYWLDVQGSNRTGGTGIFLSLQCPVQLFIPPSFLSGWYYWLLL